MFVIDAAAVTAIAEAFREGFHYGRIHRETMDPDLRKRFDLQHVRGLERFNDLLDGKLFTFDPPAPPPPERVGRRRGRST